MTKGLRWDWERSFRDAPLESGAKLVGLAMATYGDATGDDIYPSMDRLAQACSMNVKTVRKHRDELIESGWLQVIHASGGRGRANEYSLSVPETIPTVGRVKRAIMPPNPTKQREGIGPETRPNNAQKPDQTTPVNPPNGWYPTSTDQTKDHKDGDMAENLHGISLAEPVSNRRSADARDGDDAMPEAAYQERATLLEYLRSVREAHSAQSVDLDQTSTEGEPPC